MAGPGDEPRLAGRQSNGQEKYIIQHRCKRPIEQVPAVPSKPSRSGGRIRPRAWLGGSRGLGRAICHMDGSTTGENRARLMLVRNVDLDGTCMTGDVGVPMQRIDAWCGCMCFLVSW